MTLNGLTDIQSLISQDDIEWLNWHPKSYPLRWGLYKIQNLISQDDIEWLNWHPKSYPLRWGLDKIQNLISQDDFEWLNWHPKSYPLRWGLDKMQNLIFQDLTLINCFTILISYEMKRLVFFFHSQQISLLFLRLQLLFYFAPVLNWLINKRCANSMTYDTKVLLFFNILFCFLCN